jgi:YVTN family beta-propeller protein
VAVRGDGKELFVGLFGGDRVDVIDTTANPPRVVKHVPASSPFGIAANSNGAEVFVANSGTNTVSVIDTTTNPPRVFATVPVGVMPLGVAGSP